MTDDAFDNRRRDALGLGARVPVVGLALLGAVGPGRAEGASTDTLARSTDTAAVAARLGSLVLARDPSVSAQQQISEALSTGADVSLGPGEWVTEAPLLVGHERQRLVALPGAVILPNFIGDVVRVTGLQCAVNVVIEGARQPSGPRAVIGSARRGTAAAGTTAAGTAAAGTTAAGRTAVGTSAAGSTTAAGVVIGYDGANAGHVDLTNCIVRRFNGHGFVWEHGPGADFTRTLAEDCTGDGFRCTGNYDDNNHGMFRFSHAIRCDRGYAILKKDASSSAFHRDDSRHHVFQNAKAYECRVNFWIETQGNIGKLFTELSRDPDRLTRSSRGNSLTVIATETEYERLADDGEENVLYGFGRYHRFEHRRLIARHLDVQNLEEGGLRFQQLKARQFAHTVYGTDGDVEVRYEPGSARGRVDNFVGSVRFAGSDSALTIQRSASGSVTITATVLHRRQTLTLSIPVDTALSAGEVTVHTTLRGYPADAFVWCQGRIEQSGTILFSLFNPMDRDVALRDAQVRWFAVQHGGRST